MLHPNFLVERNFSELPKNVPQNSESTIFTSETAFGFYIL